jgi:hypothetical protein
MKKILLIAIFSVIFGLNAQTPAGNVSLYPNPSSGSVTILLDQAITSEVTVTISDILGNKIETVVFKPGDKLFIDFTHLNLKNGIYLFKVETNNNIYLKRLVLKQL